MVEGAYKKLKSYYFYDKTLLYIKHKIAVFESDSEKFKCSLNDITNSINNKDIGYFEQLISKMDFKVFPKKLISTNNTDVVKNNVDHEKNISKVNFFIDLPIELFILDFIWMLFIGKIHKDNFGSSNCIYAGRFKPGIFKENDLDLNSGIEFNSNRCFEPYFTMYSKWRDNAFETIKNNKTDNDLLMMSLDLKGFYYSVEFNFDKLMQFLKNDSRLKEIEFITAVIEKIYVTYTYLISKYKKGIKLSNKACVFPIGLISPVVLREIYLREFDNSIGQKINPLYYGRYVDDILIVVKANRMEHFNKDDFIETFIIGEKIALPCGNGDIKLVDYPNIKIQQEKINCFLFKNSNKDILIDVYEKQIRVISSEANLLPDIDLLKESFNNKAYNFSNTSGGNKVRDIGFMISDNYNATLFVNGIKSILKNTIINREEINPYLEEIIEFYSGSQGIEFSNSWKSIFELFVLCGAKDKANFFYKNIENYIKMLNFESLCEGEILKKRQNLILKKLRKNISEHLDFAISLAIALDYNIGKRKKHKEFAKFFRISNLLNHNLVSIPLFNYGAETLICEPSFINLTFDCLIKNNLDSEIHLLDADKLKWSPRFIHLDELHLFNFLNYFVDNKLFYRNSQNLFDNYLEYNNLSLNFCNPIIGDEFINYGNITMRKINVEDSKKDKFKIALVNTNVSETDALGCLQNPSSLLTKENKQRLFRILNTAKEEKTNFLTFPEFYLPVVWLYDISKFAKNNNISIITGLQYITCESRAYNMTCIIKSSKSRLGYKNSLLFFREKNYYAPEERIYISKLGFSCVDNTNPFYYIISTYNITFSSILCYEFTDIESRASLKAKIDALFVPQLNRDTNYFSSIVESTSRDLHCFIVQANTSYYGDSRITAPFKTDYKNIVQIKGGINDVVIVSEVNIAQLRSFQKNYDNKFQQALITCFDCKNLHGKTIKQIIDICKKCKKNLEKNRIKGLPPNFKR